MSHRAIARVVSQAFSVPGTGVPDMVLPDETQPPLTGYVLCPRGCGTRILWALSADLAEYKEPFLVYLNQQLSWTMCPDHESIQPPCERLHDEEGLNCMRSSRSVFGSGRRYVNCYE